MSQSYASTCFCYQNQQHHFKLVVLVNAYLVAWHKQKNIIQKNLVLNEYLTIIKKHITSHQRQLDVVLGVQVFFTGGFFMSVSDSPGKFD